MAMNIDDVKGFVGIRINASDQFSMHFEKNFKDTYFVQPFIYNNHVYEIKLVSHFDGFYH